ncbi:MAG: hypothetical protein CME00_10250 [Geminicoccus sp.]|nr:hypothetical protein [Geminicoccus sp.]
MAASREEARMQASEIRDIYDRDGYIAPLRLFSEDEAQAHRAIMEQTEAEHGKLHYKYEMHPVLRSPWEIATNPVLLDAVEAMLGPNILLYNTCYIVKEAGATSHVSWHQDLTYWGLSNANQVSAWVALSPATGESGCMRMLPGSHKTGRYEHEKTDDPDNVLAFGQTVQGVDEDNARLDLARLHAEPFQRPPYRGQHPIRLHRRSAGQARRRQRHSGARCPRLPPFQGRRTRPSGHAPRRSGASRSAGCPDQ